MPSAGQRARRGLAASVAAVLLCLTVLLTPAERADAAYDVSYDGAWWMPKVAIAGDSITWLSGQAFKPYLRTEWWRDAQLSFPGVAMYKFRDQIRALAATRPDVFVVQLGGNDALALATGATTWGFEQSQISGVLNDIAAAGVPCVVWIGTNEDFDGDVMDEWARRINDEIENQLAQRDIGVFADWTATAAGHPEYFVEDRAHLTPKGEEVYARLMIDGLRHCTRNPTGHLDIAAGGIGLRVAGWTFDPDELAQTEVHVYVDGAFAGVLPADKYRPDVAQAFYYLGSFHGFDGVIQVGAGRHQACVFAINVGPYGHTNPLLGCRTFDVSGSPYGYLDVAARTAGGDVLVVGWSIDSDTTGPATVQVLLNGSPVAELVADVFRPDLAAVFGQYGGEHSFATAVPANANAGDTVCLVALNVPGTPGAPRSVGCRHLA